MHSPSTGQKWLGPPPPAHTVGPVRRTRFIRANSSSRALSARRRGRGLRPFCPPFIRRLWRFLVGRIPFAREIWPTPMWARRVRYAELLRIRPYPPPSAWPGSPRRGWSNRVSPPGSLIPLLTRVLGRKRGDNNVRDTKAFAGEIRWTGRRQPRRAGLALVLANARKGREGACWNRAARRGIWRRRLLKARVPGRGTVLSGVKNTLLCVLALGRCNSGYRQ